MSLSQDTRSALAGRVGVASPVRAAWPVGEGTTPLSAIAIRWWWSMT